MATTTLPRPSLAPTEVLPPDLLIDRKSEADRLIEAIHGATGRLVVLHAAHGTGKTELIKRWMIPGLRELPDARSGYETVYGDCAQGFPEVLTGADGEVRFDDVVQRRSIIIIDNFENILERSKEERRMALAQLFARLHAPAARATMVLVTDTRQLTGVYTLMSYDAGIGSCVIEIATVGIAEGLQELSLEEPDTAVTYSPTLLQELSDEAERLEQRGWPITFRLIAVVDRHCRSLRQRSGDRVITRKECPGLLAILRAYLDEQLDALGGGEPAARLLAESVLERLATPRAEIAEGELTDIPGRLGIAPHDVAIMVARMTGTGLLRAAGEGQYQLLPPQLAAVLEERVALDRVELEPVYRIVQEGLRSSVELGAQLPRQRFEEVHRVRQHIALEQDQIHFLSACALRYDDGPTADTSRYWLRRLEDPSQTRELLFEALADDAPEVRARAAALLKDDPVAEVCDRLRRLALEDPDPSVRARAVASLAPMGNQDLLDGFIREAQDRSGAHRAQAIYALRIFRRQEVPPVLQAVVNQPEALVLREGAIHTLACLDMTESVDALLDIALRDPDEEDQGAATTALAAVQSGELNRYVLDHLKAPGLARSDYFLGAVVGLLALLVGLVLNSAAIGLGWVRPMTLVFILLLVVPTRVLLRRMADFRLRAASPLGILGLGLFAFFAVSVAFWVHGVAQMLVGRWRRGLLLFGAEVLGIVCLLGGAFAQALPLTAWLAPFYFVTGAGLFLGSFLVDVVITFFSTAQAPRGELRQRTRAIYQRTVTNPVVARLLFADLARRRSPKSRRARAILARFGQAVDPDLLLEQLAGADRATLRSVVASLAWSKTDRTVAALEERWRTAPASERSLIAKILYRRPSQRSLRALGRLRRDMPAYVRLRSTWAGWQFRFSVWPLFARMAVYLVGPALGVLLYHGAMVMINPAWSTILVLKTSDWILGRQVTDEQKIKTVAYLAEVHPEDSRKALLAEFRARRDDLIDPLSAAITQGLLTIFDRMPPPDIPARHELAAELLGAVDAYGRALSDGDDDAFQRSLQVLGSMGAAGDSTLAIAAVQALTSFVDAGGTPLDRRAQPTLDMVARLPYDRALSALDRLAGMPRNAHLVDAIRERMNQVVDTVSLRAMADTNDRKGILAVLQAVKLSPAPPSLGRSIRQLEQLISRGCDLNGDGSCDRYDTGLEFIGRDPSAEQGYRTLLDQYLVGRQYREASKEFRRLKYQYPMSIWPRKILAELSHEYLSPQDTTEFRASYQEMAELRDLPAYSEVLNDTLTFIRIEADFAEVALSARRYDEMKGVADRLLKKVRRDASGDVYRLNMALFAYIARAMRQDRGGAESALVRLRAVVDSLPTGFYNGWIYPGTVAFIEHSDLPLELRKSLTALCREGLWYDRETASKIIATNRAALKRLAGRPKG